MNVSWSAVATLLVFTLACEVSQAKEFIGGNFMLRAPMDEPKHYCLDLDGYASTIDTAAPPIVHSCKEGWWRDG